MQPISILALLLAGAAAVSAGPLDSRALPKANEYTSGDCSGPINYPHRNSLLGNVNMDPTSHSVYLAGTTWTGYSAANLKDGNILDGTGPWPACQGDNLGTLSGECVNLDTAAGQRINCVLDTS